MRGHVHSVPSSALRIPTALRGCRGSTCRPPICTIVVVRAAPCLAGRDLAGGEYSWRVALSPTNPPTARPAPEQTRASSTSSASVLQKLARVLKEKAQQDFERIVKGTSKTREKLGVRAPLPPL